MNPIPTELQKQYPCAPDRLPDRPWWRKMRATSTRLVGPGEWAERHREWLERNDGSTCTTVEEAAAIDSARPLPHPGFRVGQVWGEVKDGRISVQVIGEQSDEYLIVAGGLWLSIKKQGDGGHEWAEDWFGDSFLLADPCCPRLAPWAPTPTSPAE